MSKRDITHLTSSVRKNIIDTQLVQPNHKKQKEQSAELSFDDMTVADKALYINQYYSENEQWMLDYPHNACLKCKNLTPFQVTLYNQYCLMPLKTRAAAIYFITFLTHEQIATVGI